MDYFRAQETIDTTKLRSATFQDIGVPQQAAWCDTYCDSHVTVIRGLLLQQFTLACVAHTLTWQPFGWPGCSREMTSTAHIHSLLKSYLNCVHFSNSG